MQKLIRTFVVVALIVFTVSCGNTDPNSGSNGSNLADVTAFLYSVKNKYAGCSLLKLVISSVKMEEELNLRTKI